MGIVMNLEIHFHQQDEAAVLLKTSNSGDDEKIGEILLFCCFALRNMVNFGRNPIHSYASPGIDIADGLIHAADNLSEASLDKVSSTGPRLVEHEGIPSNRRFIAKLKATDFKCKFYLKSKGFSFFAKDFCYYASNAVFILLLHLINKRPENEEYIFSLSQAARGCGNLFLSGDVSIVNQHVIAFHIVKAIDANKQAVRSYNLGLDYAGLGRYKEAIDAFKEAIRISPDLAKAHHNMGWAYDVLGRYDEAIDAYKQAIRISPDLAEAHCNMGAIYSRHERYTEAIDAFKEAIRISPDLADAHYNMGWAYYNLRRYDEAIEAYRQEICINPDFAEVHYNMGMIYGGLERYTEAIDAFKETIRISPDLAKAHYGLGLAYLSYGDNDSALGEYEILEDLDKDLANELFDLIYK